MYEVVRRSWSDGRKSTSAVKSERCAGAVSKKSTSRPMNDVKRPEKELYWGVFTRNNPYNACVRGDGVNATVSFGVSTEYEAYRRGANKNDSVTGVRLTIHPPRRLSTFSSWNFVSCTPAAFQNLSYSQSPSSPWRINQVSRKLPGFP